MIDELDARQLFGDRFGKRVTVGGRCYWAILSRYLNQPLFRKCF